MIAKVISHVVFGVEALRIGIEVDAYRTVTPSFNIVGLPDMAVRESADRVRSALADSGFHIQANKIVINLAPADVRKEGASLDLPMALGLLSACGFLLADRLAEYSVVGELGLDGAIRSVPGVLSLATGARDSGLRGIVVPETNANEAAMIDGIEVIPAVHLRQIVRFFTGEEMTLPHVVDRNEVFQNSPTHDLDFQDVKGQAHAKRALEIAAAGAHNILLIGSPGGGKTMLARRLPSILPRMTLEESLETTKIHSIAGLLNGNQALVTIRPFRAPHYTVSTAALIGGGSVPRPGEVSLAHHGVLFLDEVAELPRSTLEVLRQPLEDGIVTISRAAMTLTFPARFLFCAAMNPCPCGYLTDERKECTCSTQQVQKYRSRLSGPLLDRIDLHIEVPSVHYQDLRQSSSGEPSATIRERIEEARAIQFRRFADQRRGKRRPHKGGSERNAGSTITGIAAGTATAGIGAPRADSASTGGDTAAAAAACAAATGASVVAPAGASGLFCNAHMGTREIKKYCALGDDAAALLETAMSNLALSARAYDRILKVACTIADLDHNEHIQPQHIAEAIQYRTLDREN